MSECISLEDLVSLFHLSIKDAAKRLGVSESTLRTLCRKYHIERWPFRKVSAATKRTTISNASTLKFQQLDELIASTQQQTQNHLAPGAASGTGMVPGHSQEMTSHLLRTRSILKNDPNLTLESALLQAAKTSSRPLRKKLQEANSHRPNNTAAIYEASNSAMQPGAGHSGHYPLVPNNHYSSYFSQPHVIDGHNQQQQYCQGIGYSQYHPISHQSIVVQVPQQPEPMTTRTTTVTTDSSSLIDLIRTSVQESMHRK